MEAEYHWGRVTRQPRRGELRERVRTRGCDMNDRFSGINYKKNFLKEVVVRVDLLNPLPALMSRCHQPSANLWWRPSQSQSHAIASNAR